MQAVVLAAGAGRRLEPVTLDRSKATVPVCGRPMLDWVLDSLAEAGIGEFVVVVHDPADDVADCCREWAAGRPLTFAVQAERRGMAHALLQAAPHLRGDFLLSACDSIVGSHVVRGLIEQYRGGGVSGVLALEKLTSPERVRQTGIVALDGERVVRIVEKPTPEEAPSDLASLPLYVFSHRLLEFLPRVPLSKRGELELQDAIAMLISCDGGVGWRLADHRWQVTSVADLLELNRLFLACGHTREDARAECIGPVYIDPAAKLGTGCRIGPNAVLEAGCRVGDEAQIQNAVVLRGAVIEPGRAVADEAVAPAG
ncbi:MAG: NTP transferase domain-containing protein [Armatimonadetes bacterium]|nr:NTP transferase domain-containing protein [Armatimonadota bacterium]